MRASAPGSSWQTPRDLRHRDRDQDQPALSALIISSHVPAAAAAMGGAEQSATATMPSGPYECARFAPATASRLRRARTTGAARRRRHRRVRVIPETSSRIAALMAGRSTSSPRSPSEFARINATNRAPAAAVDSTRTFFVRYNNLIPPMRDSQPAPRAQLRDRQAGDRRHILGGLGRVANCASSRPPISASTPSCSRSLRPGARPPAAARGWHHRPITIDFDVPVGTYLLAQEVTQAIAAQLEEVGAREHHEMEFGAFMNSTCAAAAWRRSAISASPGRRSTATGCSASSRPQHLRLLATRRSPTCCALAFGATTDERRGLLQQAAGAYAKNRLRSGSSPSRHIWLVEPRDLAGARRRCLARLRAAVTTRENGQRRVRRGGWGGLLRDHRLGPPARAEARGSRRRNIAGFGRRAALRLTLREARPTKAERGLMRTLTAMHWGAFERSSRRAPRPAPAARGPESVADRARRAE